LPARFLLTTFGSLGDLHPYIAVGKGLRGRGHAVTLGSSEPYRSKVEGEGMAFHPIRPDLTGKLDSPEFMSRVFHPRTGTEYIIRRVFLPFLEQAYEDTLAAASDADVLVGHPIAYATPIVADVLRKPWISIALAPLSMISAYDPPVISGAPWLGLFRHAGPRFWRSFWNLAGRITQSWGASINTLRRKLGLPEVKCPILRDVHSPWGTQAWFSRLFATPQPDWPARTLVTGFPFYDRLDPQHGIDETLRQFLNDGPPPVVFTLGSSALFDAGTFYAESARAAEIAGCRAILLTGPDPRNQPSRKLPDSIRVAEYAPYSELFPHAAAIVHQGGIGTTAQALRAGRPMLIVPWSHDQPDNAHRVTALGAGRTLPRKRYRAELVARELAALNGASYSTAAANAARVIAGEDGVQAACEGLENAVKLV
jgi:UDP:flavonoid glycosyltransferase YjiC (YdhE family)